MQIVSELSAPAAAPRHRKGNIVQPSGTPQIIVATKAEPHPVYGNTPIGRDGFTLERQALVLLNFWHEKAFNLHLHATKDDKNFALGKIVESKIHAVALQAKPINRREAVAQFEILARQAFSRDSVCISVDELLVLVDGLKKANEPVRPKKQPGKLQRGRKLTRAGLLVRYESFLAQELETVSWHLYGEKNVSFGRVMYDRAVTVRCAPNFKDGKFHQRRNCKIEPFLDERNLPVRARSVLKSLKIDTERDNDVPARKGVAR
jgi:hypothetical protein